jgi:signal transduction histidine kinase
MALLGLAGVLEVVMVGSSSPKTRLALVIFAAGAVVIMGAAFFGADAAARRERRMLARPAVAAPETIQRRLGELGFLISRGRQSLQSLTDRVAAGEAVAPRGIDSWPDKTGDPFVQLARAMQNAQIEAWNAVINAAGSRANGASAQRVEVFINLARRMQSLSHRAIQGLDELENQVEDPDLLKGLFKVDHLSTRMRRQAESLAVIGGAASRRQWSRPVTMYEVLRSAVAEIEHYNRVKVVPPVEGTLEGGAVADVIHLLAELIENATKFAPPQTQVLLRAENVAAGLAIEVEDRGLGIPRETQHRMNNLLTDIERVDIDEFLQDGRIGLLVVSALSRRHNIAVRLQTNLYGGTQAVVVIPNELIGSEQRETDAGPEKPASIQSPGTPDAISAAVPVPGPADATIPSPAVSDRGVAGAWAQDRSSAWDDQNAGAPAQRTERPPAPAPAAAPPPAPVPPTPAGRPASAPPTGDGRPALPRRRAQANLAPELRNSAVPDDHDDDADPGYNPGLMAAFKKGMHSGQE